MSLLKPFALMAFLLLAMLNVSAQKRGKIDIYLIGGQSNATGQGYMANMADTMHIDTSIMLFNSGRPHLNSGKAALVWQPLRQASESPDRFGLELGFASKLHQFYKAKNIGIIKHAHTGTNLYSQWNPGLNESDTAHWGSQFKIFVQTVDSGLTALRKMGYKPIIKGMLWQQGENDATATDSASYRYAEHLSHFIARLRKQFAVPNMPFIYGYVLPPPNTGADRERVRQAEHDIDQNSGSAMAVKNAFVVLTDDLSQRANDPNTRYPNDHLHFGTNGTWMLGVRMAQKLKQEKL